MPERFDNIACVGDIAIRPMRPEPPHYEHLARWLSDERVLEYVYGRDNPFDLERVIAKFGPRARGEDPARALLIFTGETPIGYMQCYRHADAGSTVVDDPGGAWGLDMFIGEPEWWGQGIGTVALRLLLRHLFHSLDAHLVTVDPRVVNARAIHVYEKAGFTKSRILPAHELHEGVDHDAWLMTMTSLPPTRRRSR